MVDAAEVRALAARAQGLAEQVGADAAGLASLRAVDWSGPASRVFSWAVDDAVRHARSVEVALHGSAAALRRHAAGVERAQALARLGVPGQARW